MRRSGVDGSMEFPGERPAIETPAPVLFGGRELSDRLAGSVTTSPPDSSALLQGLAAAAYSVCLPKQVHGAAIIEATWGGERCEGDGVVVDREALPAGKLIGVITADCLPVVLFSANKIAVLHAGWRGLANRILSTGATRIGGEITHCLIGPRAGPTRYAVGPEVLEAIGAHAKFTCSGERYLDLSATALEELKPYLEKAQVWVSSACTISDERFFSYRRDRELAGRNLTLVG
jgi:copper oxidase (laccase) domain-containing protein